MEVGFFTKILNFISYLKNRIQTQGIMHLPAFLWRRLKVELVERRYGIHTRGWIGANTITNDPNCFDYEPIDYETVQLAFSSIPGLDSGNKVLLDYGCGKGRVLAVASRYPFRRVIGVELSKYLCDVASDNLKRMRLPKLAKQAEIVHTDAREFSVPPDVTTVFLYNPFHGDVLSTVYQNIERSIEKDPRDMTIFHIHFRKAPTPFRVSKYFEWKRELPLIFREELVFDMFESNPGQRAAE